MGDPTYPDDLAISRGTPPFASTTYRPWSAIREKTNSVPSGENEPPVLPPSLVSRIWEPSALMTQRSHLVLAGGASLRSISSRRLPSRDQAIGVSPFEGPREIRSAGWLGFAAQISDA